MERCVEIAQWIICISAPSGSPYPADSSKIIISERSIDHHNSWLCLRFEASCFRKSLFGQDLQHVANRPFNLFERIRSNVLVTFKMLLVKIIWAIDRVCKLVGHSEHRRFHSAADSRLQSNEFSTDGRRVFQVLVTQKKCGSEPDRLAGQYKPGPHAHLLEDAPRAGNTRS